MGERERREEREHRERVKSRVLQYRCAMVLEGQKRVTQTKEIENINWREQ